MNIDTNYMHERVAKLELALSALKPKEATNDAGCDAYVYQAICAEEFERILKQGHKLLRRCLTAYTSSNLEVDRMVFKDVFRHAAKHDLLNDEAVTRWFAYRDTYNRTANESELEISEEILEMLPAFIVDAKALTDAIEKIHE